MAASEFYLSEIVFGPDGYVAVTNGASEALDPEGLMLCQFPNYPAVPAGPVEPGQSVRVAAADLGDLTNDSGEVGLYVRPDWSDPDAIAEYVQWGSTGHERETPAIDAGVWASDTFVDAGGAASLKASGPTTSVQGWAKG